MKFTLPCLASLVLMCSLIFLGTSCGEPESGAKTDIESDTTEAERIAPPDNAATEMDQPGVERPPVPKDSLAEGDGERPLITTRP